MAKNHVCPGKTLYYYNASTAIASGSPVLIGDVLGVALVDIPSGSKGEVAITDVFTLPKVNSSISQGQSLYWDPAGNPVGGVAGSGALTPTPGSLKKVGIAHAVAAIGDATVNIRLG